MLNMDIVSMEYFQLVFKPSTKDGDKSWNMQ